MWNIKGYGDLRSGFYIEREVKIKEDISVHVEFTYKELKNIDRYLAEKIKKSLANDKKNERTMSISPFLPEMNVFILTETTRELFKKMFESDSFQRAVEEKIRDRLVEKLEEMDEVVKRLRKELDKERNTLFRIEELSFVSQNLSFVKISDKLRLEEIRKVLKERCNDDSIENFKTELYPFKEAYIKDKKIKMLSYGVNIDEGVNNFTVQFEDDEEAVTYKYNDKCEFKNNEKIEIVVKKIGD